MMMVTPDVGRHMAVAGHGVEVAGVLDHARLVFFGNRDRS